MACSGALAAPRAVAAVTAVPAAATHNGDKFAWALLAMALLAAAAATAAVLLSRREQRHSVPSAPPPDPAAASVTVLPPNGRGRAGPGRPDITADAGGASPGTMTPSTMAARAA